MLVLHAYWESLSAHSLRVWAESADRLRTAKPMPRRAGRAKHPFAADRDALEMAVFNVFPIAAEEAGKFSLATLQLPTVGRVPLPSPAIAPTKNAGAATLVSHDVCTLQLDAFNALDFCLSLPIEPPPGMIYGQDTRFWSECAKLCIELISRQCVLPAVEMIEEAKGPVCHGRWHAAIRGADIDRVHLLAQAMPPACRAWCPDGAEEQPLAIVNDFLDAGADAFIRDQLYEDAHYMSRSIRRARGVPLTEQWRDALTSSNPALVETPERLSAFKQAVDGWFAAARAQDDAAFRVCFKVEPPDASKAAKNPMWTISFHLQAKDDPSVLLPAADVWSADAETVTVLHRVFEQPQERLLTALGLAARVFPAIEVCLENATPVSIKLNTTGAYDFMRTAAPLLEQSGFAVLLPSWWQKPATQLSVALRMVPSRDSSERATHVGGTMSGLDALVAFDWELALGGRSLSREEFDTIVSLKVPLVQIRGQWVEVRRDQIEKAIAFFERQRREGGVPVARALRTGLGGDVTDVGMPVSRVDGEGWLGTLLGKLDARDRIELLPAPAGFVGTLRPYQTRGMAWLAFLARYGLGSCLADDMGLGKTIELIAYLLARREQLPAGTALPPSLVVCPMSVVGNWQHELARFAPSLRVAVHHGADRRSGAAFERQVARHDVVITTYGMVQRDNEHLRRIAWDCLVVDEAQNIKNPETKQTQAVKQLKAAARIAMTGTPVENRLSELWSIMEFLNPGYLGGETEFRTSFAAPIERYRDTGKSAGLRRLVQPFILRRVKTDTSIINDLPEKNEMKVYCNLTREQATLYQAVVDDMLGRIDQSDGIARKGLVLAALTKLKQVCNHPAHFLGDGSALESRSGKLARFEEMVEEIVAVGDKALVFSQFAAMGELLQARVRDRFGREVLFLHGGTPKKKREDMIARFQDPQAGVQIFVLSLKAGGVGINLTAANHVFHFDRWWNPAVENQATDRAFRIGQTRNVQIHKFVCAGTVEERIDQMIEQKKELADHIVGAGEQWITEFSTDDLRRLFALGADAVSEG